MAINVTVSFATAINVTVSLAGSSGAACDPCTVNVNGTLFTTVASGGTGNIPVKNTAGTEKGSKISTDWIIPDSNITNSDDTYDVDNPAGVDLEIPDITFTDTDNTSSSKAAVQDIVATLIPALSCAQMNEKDDGLTTTQRQLIQRVKPLITGQTISYHAEDDGDLEEGRLPTITTLDCNNPFGNTNRYTDDVGTQVYANDLVCDWATMIMWYRVELGVTSWNGAIDASIVSSQGGYTDWRLPNVNEIISIVDYSLTDSFDYAPFNLVLSSNHWTSTTKPSPTTDAYGYSTPSRFNIFSTGKTSAGTRSVMIRTFTLADIGL